MLLLLNTASHFVAFFGISFLGDLASTVVHYVCVCSMMDIYAGLFTASTLNICKNTNECFTIHIPIINK